MKVKTERIAPNSKPRIRLKFTVAENTLRRKNSEPEKKLPPIKTPRSQNTNPIVNVSKIPPKMKRIFLDIIASHFYCVAISLLYYISYNRKIIV
jgi:hypothetical protein